MSNLWAAREDMNTRREEHPHLLRIVKIVLILLLQGGIQSVLGAKVGYAARYTWTGSKFRWKLR